jgi:hypothetical protein
MSPDKNPEPQLRCMVGKTISKARRLSKLNPFAVMELRNTSALYINVGIRPIQPKPKKEAIIPSPTARTNSGGAKYRRLALFR